MSNNLKRLLAHRLHWLAIAVLASIYLILESNSFYQLLPEAQHDDGLQFNIAQSLTRGEWLGDYDKLTLAKGVTYPVWLASLHAADVPLWFGHASIYLLACLIMVYAIRGVFGNRWILVVIFLILIFNPMQPARVYRDALSPALMMLLLAWSLGIILSLYNKTHSRLVKRRDFVLYTAVGAATLPAWWFLREDYFWTIPYLVVVALVALVPIWIKFKGKRPVGLVFKSRLMQSAILFIPCAGVVLAGLFIANMNEREYGRFVVNDYTSADFTSAYGALTRIHDDNWQPTVPVSESMREKAYRASPAFAELKPCLDDNGKGICEGFKKQHYMITSDDYEGGWFFWALRDAVQDAGYYDSPTKAAEFYGRVANELNSSCNEGEIRCDYPERSSLASPLRMDIIPAALDNLAGSSSYLVQLDSAVALQWRVGLTPTPDRDVMANYYNTRYSLDHVNLGSRVKAKSQELIARSYKYINPVMSVLTLVGLIVLTLALVARKIKADFKTVSLILAGWSLLVLLIFPRLVMMAYVATISFATTNSNYYASLWVVAFTLQCMIIGLVADKIISSRKKRIH